MGGTDRLKKPHSSDGTEFFLFCLWDRVLHIRLASNSLYSPGWPWTSDFEPLILPPPLPSAGVTGLLLDTLFYTVLGGNSGLFACYTAICLLSCMPSPENSALWRNQKVQEQKEGMDTGVRALGEEGLFTLMIALSCRHRWCFATVVVTGETGISLSSSLFLLSHWSEKKKKEGAPNYRKFQIYKTRQLIVTAEGIPEELRDTVSSPITTCFQA